MPEERGIKWPPNSAPVVGMAVFDGDETIVLRRNDKGEWVDDKGKVYRVSLD